MTLGIYGSVLVRPASGLRSIVRSAPLPHAWTGLLAMTGLGIAYGVTCLGLYLGGAGLWVPPVLPIAERDYYLWLTFLTLPTFLAIWLAFTVPAQLAARGLGGRGQFLSLLDATGAALALPVVVTMWVPESSMALLLVSGLLDWPTMKGWQGVPAWDMFNFVRQIGGGVWMFALAAVAIRATHDISWARTIGACALGFVPAAAISLVVIR